jgi:parallel beta-helix repeat protein
MEDCSNNTLRYNEFRNNRWNLKIRGWKLSDYIHDIDTSNTADDNPIYYFINKEDLIFEDKAVGMLGMINCKNISIENVSAMNSGQGILVTYSTNISIDNCLFNNNEYGIYLYRSSRCIITKNDISSNISTTQAGIYIESSSQNIVANNSFINFKMDDGTRLEYGIWVSHSSANIIENNVQGQITLWDGTDNTSIRRNRNCTIDIDDSSNVSIIDNQIIGTSGVGIIIGKYSDVLVEGNYISNCGISGMCISESRGNNIFKNNVIANNSDYGIEIDFMGATSENVFINNGIAGNGQDLLTGGGVWCIETQLSPIKFHNNSFVGNKWAFFISRDCQGIVDATNNWWGDESGPFDPSPLPPDFNPFGKGDWTTDFVNYRPWLTEP